MYREAEGCITFYVLGYWHIYEKVFQVLILILLWYTCAVQNKFCILLKTWVDTFALIQLSWLVIINSIVISNKTLAHIGLRVLLMLNGYIVFLGSFSDHSMLIEVDSSSFLCSDIFVGSVLNAYFWTYASALI